MQWTPDGRGLVVQTDSDLFLYRMSSSAGGFVSLTHSPGVPENDPQLSPDGKRLAFRRAHDLFVLDLDSGRETRLTSSGTDTLLNGELDWVYPEEIGLGTAYWWSPDSKQIAYLQFDISRETLYPHADFLLSAGALAEPQRYPTAGSPNATIRLGVVGATGGTTHWLSIGDTEWRYVIARVQWLRDSHSVVVHRLNRVQNELELIRFDSSTGDSGRVLRETDPYWVNVVDQLRLLPDGHHAIWSSEKESGFRHLYSVSLDDGKTVQLTSGQWEVRQMAGLDEKAGVVYYLSSEVSPLESQLYSIGIDGAGKKRITAEPGMHMVSMSPDTRYYVDISSALDRPWTQTLRRTADGESVTVLAKADPKQTEEYDIRPAEIVRMKAADNTTELYARIIRPAGFDASKKYPAIVSIYGGPHAQSVLNAWSGLSISQVLAHSGFVVFQVDNRGSDGRGHKFESAVFRKLGVVEIEDQKAAVRQLIAMGFVDPARIGVIGWSYGGFMTLNGMLRASDMFRAGIAGAPVTNFLNYDTIYTERYMGLPSENKEGYEMTNMVALAKNLKGRLMLMCNIEDDNVLFRNTLQMTNALEMAGKTFDFMLYPQKTHGVTGPLSRQLNATVLEFFQRELKPDKTQ